MYTTKEHEIMEAYTTEQVNVIILVVVYMFIVGSLMWKMSKPK